MNGSIRFNDDINIEVAVDPTAAEGARLVSATNLVDGQGIGDGGGLPDVTPADAGKVLAVNGSGEWAAEQKIFIVIISEEGTSNLTPRQAINLMAAGVLLLIYEGYIDNAPEDCFGATTIFNRVEYDTVLSKFGLWSNGNETASAFADTLDEYFIFD